MLIIRDNLYIQQGYLSALEGTNVKQPPANTFSSHISQSCVVVVVTISISSRPRDPLHSALYPQSQGMFVWKRDLQALNQTQRNVSGLFLAKSFFPCSLMKDWKAERGLTWLFLAIASLFKQWLDAFCRKKRKHMD